MKPVQRAWQIAASELNIRVLPGDTVPGIPSDPNRLIFLPDFGGPKGVVAFAQSFEPYSGETFDFDTPSSAGYYCSILATESYSHFDRDHFIDTLADWGYFGAVADRPDWLPDPNWSEQDGDLKPDHASS